MELKSCKTCHGVFSGTKRAQYCSARCRRAREKLRRVWDQMEKYTDLLEKAASLPDNPPDRREFYRRKAEGLRRRLGPRP